MCVARYLWYTPPRPVRPTVLLFDVDGTLVSTGGAGRRAMERAFTKCFGKHALEFSFAGMTDPAILRLGTEALGRSADEASSRELAAAYLEALSDELTRTTRFVVHDGVREVLDAVRDLPRVAVGLGTGNFEEGARLKLDVPGLMGRFSFGGYGSDHEDRAELVRTGIARGAAQLGVAVTEVRAVVIGDTPRDVAAAKASSAECLAVSNGYVGVDALRSHGPTLAVETLTDPKALRFLRGAS